MPPENSTRINRLLRNVFFAAAILLVAYAALFANYLKAAGENLFHAKMIWATLAAAIFFVIAGWKFSLKTKFKIFAVLLCVLLLEILLQITAWLGVLPAVNTKLKAPFARIYWTSEGRGNGIRNRFGWYFPGFDLKAAHKIAYVGDSQVEAVEVSRTQNQAADLQKLLKAKSPDWSVLGLGTHGTCPAYSMDVLEYAWRHFRPQEAVVVVSIGSDVSEASPKLNYSTPDKFIYYDLNPDGDLVLNPASADVRAGFDRSLEFSHQPLLTMLPVILNSHCMILQMADSLRDNFYTRRQVAKLVARGDEENGFNPAPFAVNPSPDAQEAMKILLAQLAACKKICDSHGMKFKLVTVPSFPKEFYDTQHGTNWTMRIGNYDYFGPERKVVDWANENEIPIISIGHVIEQKKLSVDEIHSLYFANGTGHLTPKGHELCAEAVFEKFYASELR
jgi:hypothetical protein